MTEQQKVRSKLELQDERIVVGVDEAIGLVSRIFENIGCSRPIAREVAEHLADANLCGMESHGLMRTLQYAEQFESGYMRADAEPEIRINDRGGVLVDGNGGIGIPAMRIGVEEGCRSARQHGVSALAVVKTPSPGQPPSQRMLLPW